MKKGFVYLIGAGPGDPGLFTIKGKRLLEEAEVVVYDRLISTRILSYANPQAELIYVGKEAGRHALSQDEINELLVEKAQDGKKVVRLKGGDPFVFGRGGEEAMFIRKHGLEFEVVPGITSAVAVPAYAGIPVTHRDKASSFAVITGHERPGKVESSIDWKHISIGAETLVFLMGIENLAFIVEQLLENGRDVSTPIALIRWGTLPRQEVLTGTLGDITEKVKRTGFKSPAVIVVGNVVELREEINWLEKRPLFGKHIVVTRARQQASILADKLEALGGIVTEFPAISIEKENDLHILHNAINNIDKYDWVIFTSVNAVNIFFAEIKTLNQDIRNMKGIRLCAIGPATQASLEEKGLKVELVPDEYRAEGIIDGLREKVKPGQWVLIPRARGARSVLPDTLRSWKVHVNEVFLYKAVPHRNVSQAALDSIKAGNIDYITFTSSSTVTNFVKIIGKENVKTIDSLVKTACIGPITAATAKEQGFNVKVIASEYTIDGLVKAIVDEEIY